MHLLRVIALVLSLIHFALFLIHQELLQKLVLRSFLFCVIWFLHKVWWCRRSESSICCLTGVECLLGLYIDDLLGVLSEDFIQILLLFCEWLFYLRVKLVEKLMLIHCGFGFFLSILIWVSHKFFGVQLVRIIWLSYGHHDCRLFLCLSGWRNWRVRLLSPKFRDCASNRLQLDYGFRGSSKFRAFYVFFDRTISHRLSQFLSAGILTYRERLCWFLDINITINFGWTFFSYRCKGFLDWWRWLLLAWRCVWVSFIIVIIFAPKRSLFLNLFEQSLVKL